jgi:raffinose/stachyose/melibiose transport system permease protein
MKNLLRSKNSANLMYIPALILFAVFVIYPLFSGLQIAFTNWNGFSSKYSYVGLQNFKTLFADKNFYRALRNTMIYGFGSTVFQQLLGLSYAMLFNKAFRGRTFGRVVIYLPVLIAPVIMGYMYYFFFQYNLGALNDILVFFGMEKLDWLASGDRSVWIITAVNTIQYCGVSMIIYLAGLQGISKTFYEAADIDGATPWQQFTNVTLPLLYPAIVSSVTFNLIGGLKLFDAIKALTAGGPGYSSHSLSTLIDYAYFRNQAAGYSSAIGIILFLIIMVVSLSLQLYMKKREVDL